MFSRNEMNGPKMKVVSKDDSSQLHFLLRLIQTHFGPNVQKLIWVPDIKILPEIVVSLTGWLVLLTYYVQVIECSVQLWRNRYESPPQFTPR